MTDLAPALLLLEGDEATRELYRRELGRRYRVIPCRSEDEVFAFLERESASALLLEPRSLRMAESSFIEEIRGRLHGQLLPIVLCSVIDARRQWRQWGAAAYFVKPVAISRLLVALDPLVRT
jgi:response regulator RpfG family c-di-GMP phosphodiesterase